MGQRIWDFSHGVDNRQVQPHRERKSVGVEKTLSENIRNVADGLALLPSLYDELIQRLLRQNSTIDTKQIKKIGVKLKFADFQVTTLEKTGEPCSLTGFSSLLEQIWQRARGREVRLVGISLALPEKQWDEQLDLWQ